MNWEDGFGCWFTAGDLTHYAAKRRFGNTTLVQENSHAAWGWGWLENLFRDASYGMRAMLRSAGITIIALFSLARINEIGIRMALGSARSNVLWMMLRESLTLVIRGIMIGVPVALAGDRMIANKLFGLKSTDPVTLASATTVLLLVATIAGYVPARRASLVDPMLALRYE